eukprot:m.139504 g.139504  ORF g.139504 m.139504 type:complete len:65 (+) comp17628_c0_seq1:334-528(+)
MALAQKGSTPPNFVGMYDFGGTLGVGKYSVVKLATVSLADFRLSMHLRFNELPHNFIVSPLGLR